jgi:hypothetical protein
MERRNSVARGEFVYIVTYLVNSARNIVSWVEGEVGKFWIFPAKEDLSTSSYRRIAGYPTSLWLQQGQPMAESGEQQERHTIRAADRNLNHYLTSRGSGNGRVDDLNSRSFGDNSLAHKTISRHVYGGGLTS